MLAVAGFFSRDVPVGHPAELLAFRDALEHDQKRLERDFFRSISQPRLQLVREKRPDHLEVSVAGAQLEVEIQVQFARASAGRAVFRSHFREIVEGVEQFVVRGIFLLTLSAVNILGCHVQTFLSEGHC
jgi:hypothetical protein